MKERISMSDILYKNGLWYNTKLNNAGIDLKSFFINLIKEIPFAKNIHVINITSQQRLDDIDKQLNSPHYKNLAVDFVVEPISMMPWIWSMINRYRFGNVYLSSVPSNIHIHYDVDYSSHSNYKRLETEQTPIDMSVPKIDDTLYEKINWIYGKQDKVLMFEQNPVLKFTFNIDQKKNPSILYRFGWIVDLILAVGDIIFRKKDSIDVK
jgi:hypothetical protein